MYQKTIANTVSIEGKGLHTANKVKVTFKPAQENTGIIFIPEFSNQNIQVKSSFENVAGTVRGTSIGFQYPIYTVEHILSAVTGLGIDNLYIILNNNEPPICDGSSLQFVQLLESAGIINQSHKKKYLKITESVEYISETTIIRAQPYDNFLIECIIEYDHPLIKRQELIIEINPENYKKEISSARTYAFDFEVEYLRRKELAKGGDLTNSIVIGYNKIFSENGLRFPDEFVRHKILDFIGDFSLLSINPLMKIYLYKTGHRHNLNFIKNIAKKVITV